MRATCAAIALVLASSAAPAAAQSFAARTGETGILDVPDAETLGPGMGQLATEFRFDHAPGFRNEFGPLPLYTVAGLAPRLDVGLTMRDWGQPGDERPARMHFGGAAKIRLLAPGALFFGGAALSFVADRITDGPVLGARLAVSTVKGPFRAAAFAGAEGSAADGIGPTAGIAGTLSTGRTTAVAAEALTAPRGTNVGAALRWMASPVMGVSLGGNYFPADGSFRIALTLALSSRAKAEVPRVEAARTEEPPEEQPVVAGAPRFRDDRPKLRLRMAMAGPSRLEQDRHVQYGPYVPSAGGAIGLAAAPKTPTAVKSSAPSLEDLAEAQVREQEGLADARERRVRSTSDQLDAREKAALAEAKRLEERERDLTTREQELDARERRISVRNAPSQQQRQLESLEAQLAAQERQYLAQERSLAPAIEAAQGRERDAVAREETERAEANRLAAAVSATSARAQQLELRKQAIAAKNRQFAALEARLVARGERIDALERQNRTKGARLDAWSRRLDTRSERLDLLEKRATESRPAAAPKPAEAKPGPAPKDKAVFVMVVKSPTAIVKERGEAKATPQAGTALHPGVAVEKAVAAATVVSFPTPASQLSELDRETVDNIAKLAAKERCELLIWARAKDAGLMADAQRRANEIKTRAVSVGPLDQSQVVVRITTRPGAQGVDVVVSALRETAKPAAAPAAAPAGPTLQGGESGKRQLREAVLAAQPSIEACIGDHMQAQRLQRAEGSLKLTVSNEGKVTKVSTSGRDLEGERIESCLGAAAAGWQFPSAEAEYAVDVPITVVGGGPAK